MSHAFCVTPASSFIYDCLHNGGGFHARTGFQKNFEFIYNNNSWLASGLQFVRRQKLKSNQVHRLCKVRDGLNSGAASYCAASSFNDGVGDFKDCGRVEGVEKKAADADGSDTNNTSYGHGNGYGQGNHRGGGYNGGTGNGDSRGGGYNDGTGNGGLGDFADWGGVIWFCWRIYKVWTYYFNSANISSSEVVPSEIGNIPVKTKECAKKRADSDSDSEELRRALKTMLTPICEDFLEPVGMMIAAAICATLLAGAFVLGCVVSLVIWIWRSLWS